MQRAQQPIRMVPQISRHEAIARVALAKLERLQSRLSAEHQIFKTVTYEDLLRSPSLCSLILDYNLTLFREDPKPLGSFERTYANSRDKEVVQAQSTRQSSLYKVQNTIEEVAQHNKALLNEYREEERGLETTEDRKIDMKVLKRQIKDEIKLLAQSDPEKAEEMDDFIFGAKNDIDEALERVIPEDEILYYPGSIKGLEPEDDPESWAKWYFDHQPKSAFKDGKILPADLGVKYKFIKSKDEGTESGEMVQNVIYQRPENHFFEVDELHYDQENYGGRPEFTIFKKSNFTLQENQKAPEFMFQSSVGPNELPPIQPDAPWAYQDLHMGLEKWSIFRMLPQILKYDREWNEWMTNVNKGMAICPEFHAERNQPSLWTYYHTLPEWCRNNPLVRQTLFAFEYNKPHLDIRQKEMGLNFMASMLRPVEGRFKTVITEVAYSNKIRVTIQNGKQMMNELNFYIIDKADLGSDTEDDGDDEAAEKEFARLLLGGLDEEEALERGNMLERVMKAVGETDLEQERRKIYDEEQTITEYELDPEVQKCMVDFPTKPYAEIDDVQAAAEVANENQVPINYYDNDDGFWDDYIAAKQQSQVEAGFITNRRWFKH